MKRFYTIVLCTIVIPCFSQIEVQIDRKQKTGLKKYNKLMKALGRDAEMTYQVEGNEIVYYLNGDKIASPFVELNNTDKDFNTQCRNHSDRVLIDNRRDGSFYIPKKDKTAELIIRERGNIQIYTLKDFKKNGSFTQLSNKGEKIINGNFSNIDTNFVVENKVYSTETYEEEIQKTNFTEKLVRSGNWKYYDSEGQVVLEENYPGTANGSLYGDILCVTSKDDFYPKRNVINNDFLVFNSLCQIFDIDLWLQQFARYGNKDLYLNGKWIESAKRINQANGLTVYEIIDNDVSIRIFSKEQGAALNKNAPVTHDVSATIAWPDATIDEISFKGENCIWNRTIEKEQKKEYQERTCSGQLISSGNFCLEYAPSRDTVTVINPDTYETQIQITETKYKEEKCGSWKYYDKEGKLVKEEEMIKKDN